MNGWNGKLLLYVIYYNAIDYPDKYVIKRYDYSIPQDPENMQQDPTYVFVADDLETCRGQMLMQGLIHMPKNPDDHPVIVETWI